MSFARLTRIPIYIKTAEASPVSAVFGCVPINETGMQLSYLTAIYQIQGGKIEKAQNADFEKPQKKRSLARNNIRKFEREIRKVNIGKMCPKIAKTHKILRFYEQQLSLFRLEPTKLDIGYSLILDVFGDALRTSCSPN